MAIYSCNISNVSRAKGSSSCATLSYITGERVKEERTGETYSYGRSERVVETKTILPNSAPVKYKDPKILFNEIETYEKASNARTAKKIMLALPKEFDLETQKTVLEKYINKNITAQGYACTYAIHIDKDSQNPHAHILIANRQINDKGEWGSKRKMEYALDEKGNRIPRLNKETGEQITDKKGRKQWVRINAEVNPLDKKESLENLREQWAFECNELLAPEQQIDHRSFAAQGKEEEPTIHEGYVARKIEKQGGTAELCEKNRQIGQRNTLLKQIQVELKKIQETISALVQEKGANINERIADIIKRRKALADGRGTASGERTERETDTEAIIRKARAEIIDSRAAEKNSGTEREYRNAERQRQGAAKEQTALERERKKTERSRDFEK